MVATSVEVLSMMVVVMLQRTGKKYAAMVLMMVKRTGEKVEMV